MEVTEAGKIHSHQSCRRPTRCTPVAFDFKERGKMEVKGLSIASLPMRVCHLLCDSGS